MHNTDIAVYIDLGSSYTFLTDVTDFLDTSNPLKRKFGRESDFDQVAPGQFSFTLSNPDGRFTPDRQSQVYQKPLSEGALVMWSVGGRVLAGKVLSIDPTFPLGNPEQAMVTVTCTDPLGLLERRKLVSLQQEFNRLGAVAYWPLDDPAAATEARELVNQYVTLEPAKGTGAVEFGSTDVGPLSFGDGAFLNTGRNLFSKTVDYLQPSAQIRRRIPQDWAVSGSANHFRVVYTLLRRNHSLSGYAVELQFKNRPLIAHLPGVYTTDIDTGREDVIARYDSIVWDGDIDDGDQFNESNGRLFTDADNVEQISLTIAETYHSGTGLTDVRVGMVFDGNWANQRTIERTDLDFGGSPMKLTDIRFGKGFTGSITNIAFFEADLYDQPHPDEDRARRYGVNRSRSTPTFMADLASLVDPARIGNVNGVPVTIASGFSNRRVGPYDSVEKSLLQAFNDGLAVEQGTISEEASDFPAYLWNPGVQVIGRNAAHPDTVKYELDVDADLIGAPEFVRDLADRVGQVTGQSLLDKRDVFDTGADPWSGATTDSIDAPVADADDLIYLAQDRIYRGKQTQFRVRSVVVDATRTATDRFADLLGTKVGDRIRITGIPAAQLGFDTFDGWFLGGEESHSATSNLFTMYFAPCMDPLSVSDDALFDASGTFIYGGTLYDYEDYFDVDISDDAEWTTYNFPLDIVVDGEQMTLTSNVTSTYHPGMRTFSVVRGVNNTFAKSHIAGDLGHPLWVTLAKPGRFAL